MTKEEFYQIISETRLGDIRTFAETSIKRVIIAVPGNDNNYRVLKREFGA